MNSSEKIKRFKKERCAFFLWGLLMSVYSKKEEKLRKKVEKKPADQKAWLKLGDHLFENRRFEEAIEAYQRVIEVGRFGTYDAGIGIGNAYLKLGKFEEAKEAFTSCTEYVPSNCDGWIGLKNATQDSDETFTSIQWPIVCMGCGLDDEDLLTLTEYAIEARIDPLGSSAMSTGGVVDAFMSGKNIFVFTPIMGVAAYAVKREQRVIPILHYHLPIHMYTCSKCNPFNQDYTRFIEILVKQKKNRRLFYEFGYFRNDTYKERFFELNPETIVALYKMEDRK